MFIQSALFSPVHLFSSIRSEMLDRALITERADVIGSGAFGIVVDTGRDSVLKLLRRFDAQRQNMAQKLLNHELETLTILQGDNFDGIQTPALIGDITYIDHKDFFAAFEMTKLPGLSAKIMSEDFGLPDKVHMYQSIGSALGRLHIGLHDRLGQARANLPSKTYTDGLVHSPLFSDEINSALERLRAFIKQRRVPAPDTIIHGDFHLGNIMVNETGCVTGVIDWSDTHVGHNLTDIAYYADSNLREIWAAYAGATGQALDQDLFAVAKITWQVGYLKIIWGQQEKWDYGLGRLETLLTDSAHITGFALR